MEEKSGFVFFSRVFQFLMMRDNLFPFQFATSSSGAGAQQVKVGQVSKVDKARQICKVL